MNAPSTSHHRQPAVAWGIALAALVAALALRAALDSWLGPSLPFVTVFAAIALTVWHGGLLPAAAVALLGFLGGAWFFLGAPWLLGEWGRPQFSVLAAYGLSCAVLVGLVEALRRAFRDLQAQRSRLERELAEQRAAEALARREIDERHQAEHALRRAHDTLDTIVRSSPLPLVVIDVEPPLVRLWNPAAERLFGWSAAEVLGRPVPVYLPGQEEEGRQMRRQVLGSAAAVEFEAQRRCADGQALTVRIAAMPLRSGDGEVAGILLLYRDVTARRRAEAALVRSEATLRAFYDNAPVCMGVVELTDDDDVLHLYDNPVTCRLFGVPAGRTANRLASVLGATPQNIALWIEHYRRSERSRAPVSFEFDVPTPEGQRWLSATVSALAPGASGRTRYCYVSEDITERHRSAERLQESEAAARLALQVARLGTWRWEPVGNTLTADARAREICGLPADGPLGLQDVSACLHPDDAPRIEAALLQALRPDGSGEYAEELRLVHPNGEAHWALSRGQMLYSGEGAARRPTHLLGTLLDITRRKTNEQLLLQADRRKDEFLATLAHELRNPLAPVRNGVHLLRKVTAGVPAAARPLALIDRQVGHMVRLIDDLMDVSRVGSDKIVLRRERLALASVLQQAVEISQPLFDAAGHALDVTLPDADVVVDGDLTRLSQVVANLLNNAAKYTPPGGRIGLSAELEGAGVTVTVADDGLGIPRDMLARVFDMFTQVDRNLERAQGGLGIGLAIARRLAELHGGRLEAHSEGAGRGSRFLLHLPLAARQDGSARIDGAHPAGVDGADGVSGRAGTIGIALPARPADQAGQEGADGAPRAQDAGAADVATARLRVLIADDNADAADSLGQIVALMGHEVRIARDGLQALQLGDGFRPDIALLDIGMPGLSGYEVAVQLRSRDWAASLKLIAVTGWGQPEDRRRSSAAGFDRHVVKPVEPESIVGLLRLARTGADAERSAQADARAVPGTNTQ